MARRADLTPPMFSNKMNKFCISAYKNPTISSMKYLLPYAFAEKYRSFAILVAFYLHTRRIIMFIYSYLWTLSEKDIKTNFRFAIRHTNLNTCVGKDYKWLNLIPHMVWLSPGQTKMKVVSHELLWVTFYALYIDRIKFWLVSVHTMF
jgi:hypothetical protein